MRESIHKYFQVGTIQWMTHPRKQVLQSIKELASDDFFDAIEVRHFQSDEEREKAKKLLAQSHMKVCYGAQPTILSGLNPNAIEESERKKAEDALVAALDEAQYLGADTIAFLAGRWEKNTQEKALEQLIKTTVNVCREAAVRGMKVELEVFDFDMDKSALIGPAPFAARYAAKVREQCSNFGLLVDLSHFPTTYEDSRFVIQMLRPFITHLHFGNAVVKEGCEAYGDKHPRFGFPESANDTEQLLEYFSVLKEEGFFREHDPYVLSMEVTPYGDEDEDIILANTKRVVNRAWAMLQE